MVVLSSRKSGVVAIESGLMYSLRASRLAKSSLGCLIEECLKLVGMITGSSCRIYPVETCMVSTEKLEQGRLQSFPDEIYYRLRQGATARSYWASMQDGGMSRVLGSATRWEIYYCGRGWRVRIETGELPRLLRNDVGLTACRPSGLSQQSFGRHSIQPAVDWAVHCTQRVASIEVQTNILLCVSRDLSPLVTCRVALLSSRDILQCPG